MIIIQQVRAPSDPNGNPRRGWLVCYPRRKRQTIFVDMGFHGETHINAWLPKVDGILHQVAWSRVVVLPTVHIRASQYSAFKRGDF